MLARNQAQRLIEVRPQLVSIASLARIIARRLNAPARQPRRAFKAAHIIALPAVQRNRSALQRLHRLLHVHAQLRVLLAGQIESLLNGLVSTHESLALGTFVSDDLLSSRRGISSLAIRPVQPVWCEAPRPRPVSPWKYSWNSR